MGDEWTVDAAVQHIRLIKMSAKYVLAKPQMSWNWRFANVATLFV